MSALEKEGIQTTFDVGKFDFQNGALEIATGDLNGPLYVIKTESIISCT